jgi:hypothetical protein
MAARPTLETATGEWFLSDLMPAPAEAAQRIAVESKALLPSDDGPDDEVR